MPSRIPHYPQPRRRGFTLIELLVVLVILGLLAGLVGPQLMKNIGTASRGTAEQQVEQFVTTLDMYRLEVGRYPSSDEGLEALIQQPSGVDRWNGPYLRKEKLPMDPWGNEYVYRAPGDNGRPFEVYSMGADGAPGGEGDNQDIVSWE
ncbi:MAG: type II secretion system major pseudopilin GspG [Candidatus Competibacterales bacterium]